MKMALVTTFRIAFKMGEVMSGGGGGLSSYCFCLVDRSEQLFFN